MVKCPDESIIKTIEYLEKNKIGTKKTNFRLKDWGISSRDIGAAQYQLFMMKMVIQKNFKDMLPVELPKINKLEPTGNP